MGPSGSPHRVQGSSSSCTFASSRRALVCVHPYVVGLVRLQVMTLLQQVVQCELSFRDVALVAFEPCCPKSDPPMTQLVVDLLDVH